MKKTYILPALFFVTLSSLASCNLTPTVTGVELDKTEETLFVGSSTSLNYLVSRPVGSAHSLRVVRSCKGFLRCGATQIGPVPGAFRENGAGRQIYDGIRKLYAGPVPAAGFLPAAESSVPLQCLGTEG